MRFISCLFVSFALINGAAEVAAQNARPLPPVLILDGEPVAQPSVNTNNTPAGGVPRESILFSEDWESQPIGVKASSFANWTRVSDGAEQDCSVTEIVSGGGPKGGNAYRAFLEDSGTCGRAELKLEDPVVDELRATYVGNPPVPTIQNGQIDDHFIYQNGTPATCSSCRPDEIGFMFAVRPERLPNTGEQGVIWQYHTAGYDHSVTEDEYHTNANPVFGLSLGLTEMNIFIRRNDSPGSGFPLVVSASDLSVGDFEGKTLEIYGIVRFDSRTDAEGGDGYYALYVELEGNEPTIPKFVWNGQTMHPGLYRYKGTGEGPLIGDPSSGLYHDIWRNNGTTSGLQYELYFDNYMWVTEPNITEMFNTMQLSDYSSLK